VRGRQGGNQSQRECRCSVPELPLVAPPIIHRLVGNPAVIGAIGQVVCRVPATEEEVRAAGVADRPPAIWRNATTAIVVSSTSMNVGTTTIAATTQGLVAPWDLAWVRTVISRDPA